MKKLLLSIAGLMLGWGMLSAQSTYTKITTADSLVDGGRYLVVASEQGTALGIISSNNKYRMSVSVTISAGVVSTEVGVDGKPFEITLRKDGSNWNLYDAVADKYISQTSGQNEIPNADDAYTWSISFDGDGNALIKATADKDSRRMQYNSNEKQERFSAYKGTQKEVQLYKAGGVFVDETAPEVKYVVTESAENTTIEVHFSEALDTVSAETAANYTLNKEITVSAAKLQDAKTVVLTVSSMTEGVEYELTINGVKDVAGNAIKEDTKITFTFGAAEVEDIAAVLALRNTYAEAQKYRIKGDVVVVAHSGKYIYVQDKDCADTKGHSVLLYDQPGTYAEKFAAGAVLKNVAGSLTIYNGLLEMQYLAENITEEGTAEVVVSKAKLLDVATDTLYHSALVRIENVEIDGTGSFEGGTTYSLFDADENKLALRINSSDDIVGEAIPTKNVTVIGYVGVYYGVPQLYIRSKADIFGESTANEAEEAVKFVAYPNPTNGILYVEAEAADYSVRVYSVAGLEVAKAENLNGKAEFNLSNLAKGLYVVEVRAAEGASYTKVIVR